MSAIPPIIAPDRECLEAWRRQPGIESLRPLVGRYGAFVYSSAYRRTGNADLAAEATRAVFLVLARRARRLRKKTVLAGWLFHVTAIACRKLLARARREQRRAGFQPAPDRQDACPALWSRLFRRRNGDVPPDATLWTRVAPEIDAA